MEELKRSKTLNNFQDARNKNIELSNISIRDAGVKMECCGSVRG